MLFSRDPAESADTNFTPGLRTQKLDWNFTQGLRTPKLVLGYEPQNPAFLKKRRGARLTQETRGYDEDEPHAFIELAAFSRTTLLLFVALSFPRYFPPPGLAAT